MGAPKEIIDLVERFEREIDVFKSTSYNEAQLRREFLDPFFKALGWDIDNTQGYAEAYKDVIHEDSIRIGEATKAPDYCFRIGGARKFFLEAKKPSIDIKNDIHPAFQLRRYAWTTKLPLSVLSDFEEFAVYDCRIRPDKSDDAATARVLYFTFRDYVPRWDEIANIFGREAILKGSFDRFAESSKLKRGTADVDEAFLQTIEGWRKELAQNIALRNRRLSQRELNFAVQRIIDRIIFLRICEGRGIEDYGRLRALANGERIYPRLVQLFDAADERFNSGLFHFKREQGRLEAPDELTPGLKIDDKLLRDILEGLYYPECPYVFSALSADILGQVYEQFLGKVVRLTEGHQARVDDKPEVKRAGGVYYTPTYIADYIVRQTVGALLQKKTLRQAEKIKILDPACGSGSFLIVAYQFLLDWHLQHYLKNDPAKHSKGSRPALVQTQQGGWKLSIGERKRILTNSIFGVDIDPQAVEVTKLSLLLKVLEGETGQTLQTILRLFQERALPDLADNIKCGNSLVGPDYFEWDQIPLLEDDERLRLNVFDWKTEFPSVFLTGSSGKLRDSMVAPLDYSMPGVPLHGRYATKKIRAEPSPASRYVPDFDGGFDAVIGNPPYGFHQIHDEKTKAYFKLHYVSSAGSFEHYFLFYEAALKKLAPGGYLGFIAPVTWLTIPSALNLRKFVLQNFALRSIAWLPDLVFKNAQVNTLVSIIQREKPGICRILVSDTTNPALAKGDTQEIPQRTFVGAGFSIRIFESSPETILLDRIDALNPRLSAVARPCSGYNPYEVGKGAAPNGRPHTEETIRNRPFHSAEKLGKEWKPEAIGRDLRRYFLQWPKHRFIKYGSWLAAPRDPANFTGPRLLVQEITGGSDRRIIATYCDQELYHSRDIIPIKCDLTWPSPYYLLGVLNSAFITWRHHRRSPKARKALFPKVLVSDLANIPIPHVDPDIPADKSRHDALDSCVRQMLALQEKLADATIPQEQNAHRRQIQSLDGRIEDLVRELYRLTAEEITLVERPLPPLRPPHG